MSAGRSPDEAGYWSVTTADDIHEVSRDWQTYSSERGGITAVSRIFPVDPDHQAFGAGGRHFCLGAALGRLELRIMFEETLARYPAMEMAGAPVFVESPFVNQLKTLPVRMSP